MAQVTVAGPWHVKTAMHENDLAAFYLQSCELKPTMRRTTDFNVVLAEKLPKWRLRPCARDGPQIWVFSLVPELSVAFVHVR